MMYCTSCIKLFPYEDTFDEVLCPACGITYLEDINLDLDDDVNIYCTKCNEEHLEEYILETLHDEEEILICPKCKASDCLELTF